MPHYEPEVAAELERFGDVVRAVRNERGLSQEDLAERAHLHRTYIGHVERGERNLTLKNIRAIAAALGTSAEDLMRRSGL